MKKTNTLLVLEAMEPGEQSAVSIAWAAKVSKDRTYIILATLVDLGYAKKSNFKKKWKLLVKGNSVLNRLRKEAS